MASKVSGILIALMIWWIGQNACAAEVSAYSNAITGGVFRYSVQPGDTLKKIGARFGTSPSLLAAGNALERNAALQTGDALWVNNMHIVPEWRAEGIVINLPQRMLFHFSQGNLVAAFPVDWANPTGRRRPATSRL